MIILIRHAQSEFNSNHDMCAVKMDADMDLTPNGELQAREIRQKLCDFLIKETGNIFPKRIHFYCSPYKRTKKTLSIILEDFNIGIPFVVSYHQELTEQSQGNLLPGGSKELHQLNKDREINRFYYKFPNGESSQDVYFRSKAFYNEYLNCVYDEVPIVIGHGRQLRTLIMAFQNRTPEWFNEQKNFPNGSILVFNSFIDEPTIL
jgi:broad specificity phosphatase PhoE